MNRLKHLSLYIFLGLLAYMPFHIFLSTWIGTSLNVLDFMKVAKDGVLVIGFLAALIVSLQKAWFKQLAKDKLVWLIVVYSALTVVIALLKPTDQDAEVLGVVYNTRFLLFFLYGLLLSKLFDAQHLKKRALQVVLGAAVIVLFFGVIQYTVLPDKALEHVGYSRANGVLPAFFIDDKPDLERVMSTLRDPNSLGSYVLIILGFAATGILGVKQRAKKQIAGGLLVLCGLCLVFTFSRSAWLGAVLTIVAAFALSPKASLFIKGSKQRIGLSVLAFVCVMTFAGVLFKDSYFVQNVIIHADETTVLEDPNQLRVRFFRESVEEVKDEPLGHGPGTAGLASVKNDVQGVKINENYYLQIAYEVGVIGLVIFVSIIAVVGGRLLSLNSLFGLALLAGLVGLSLTNFLVHIWSSEAVAYTWWGLTGLVLMQRPVKTAIIGKQAKSKREIHG